MLSMETARNTDVDIPRQHGRRGSSWLARDEFVSDGWEMIKHVRMEVPEEGRLGSMAE